MYYNMIRKYYIGPRFGSAQALISQCGLTYNQPMLGPGLNHRGKHGMMTEGAAGDGLRPRFSLNYCGWTTKSALRSFLTCNKQKAVVFFCAFLPCGHCYPCLRTWR